MGTAVILLSLLISGLLVGNELCVALFAHPVLYTVSNSAHAIVAKPLARRLGRSMPPWYIASTLFAIFQLLAIGSSSPAAWSLCLAAIILMAIIIVLTILLPVPINNRIAALDPDRLPSDWLQMRRRWDLYHQVRVVLLIIMLALLILSALLR